MATHGASVITTSVLSLCASLWLAPGSAPAVAQSVPGFTVGTYATSVPGPIWIDLAPDGTLFAGRDSSFTGTPNPQFITRVEIGGAPVGPLGVVPTVDPDPVVFDAAGIVSGVPGSVLTGGVNPNSPPAHISAIRPDGSVVQLWTSMAWQNVREMKFDRIGRLLFIGAETRSVWVSAAGEPPTILLTLPVGSNPHYLAVAPDNRIFVASDEGRIRIYGADGALLDGGFATLPGLVAIEFGTGAGFGKHLYAFRRADGTLFRVRADGTHAQIGSGFGSNHCMDIAVGPDGRIFISRFVGNAILALSYEGCACDATLPADLDCDGSVGAPDLAILLGAWGTKDCAADLDEDGIVGASDLAILLGAWGS